MPDGVPPSVVADAINRMNVAGLRARSFDSLVSASLRPQVSFLSSLRLFLLVGLLLGMAGTSVLIASAVRDRRPDIALLRSLGFDREMIRTAFLAEAATVALISTALGCTVGLLLAWRAGSLGLFGRGTGRAIPWSAMVFVLVVVPAACVLASHRAANSASPTTSAGSKREPSGSA